MADARVQAAPISAWGCSSSNIVTTCKQAGRVEFSTTSASLKKAHVATAVLTKEKITQEKILENKATLIIDGLIREYFSRHEMKEALLLFDMERPRTENSIKSGSKLVAELSLSKQCKQHIKTTKKFKSVLEVFVHNYHSPDKKPGKAPKRSKPRLKVVVEDDEFNCVGHPGSTPKAISEEPIVHLVVSEEKPYIDRSTPGVKSILRKPGYEKKTNRIQFVEDKESFFCKHAPSNLLSPNAKHALNTFKEFAQTPTYRKEYRYVELQSSDVAKYTIGQMVTDIGPDNSVSGRIDKKKGSKQCGNSGPGLIVIDTFPSDDEDKKMAKNDNEEDILGDLLSETSCVAQNTYTVLNSEDDVLMDQLLIS